MMLCTCNANCNSEQVAKLEEVYRAADRLLNLLPSEIKYIDAITELNSHVLKYKRDYD